MAEATEETAAETPIAEESQVDESKVEGADEPTEEKEDRGDIAVYERKSHQAVKKLEGELQAEREARIRLEEQVRFLGQAKTEKVESPKIYTPEEVQTAVDAGNLSAAKGAAYLARLEAEKVFEEKSAIAARRAPIDRAKLEIHEHRKLNPWIDDQGDSRRKEIDAEYYRLVGYGHHADERTQLVAVEKIVGSLDAQRKRHEMANLTRSHSSSHAEVSSGGADSDSKVDLSKASSWQKQMWEKTKTPLKARAEELRLSQAMKAGKRVT